jgi:hypothetical protein
MFSMVPGRQNAANIATLWEPLEFQRVTSDATVQRGPAEPSIRGSKTGMSGLPPTSVNVPPGLNSRTAPAPGPDGWMRLSGSDGRV